MTNGGITMNAHVNKYIDDNVAKMTASLSKIIAVPSVRSEGSPEYPYGKDCADALNTMLGMAEEMGFICTNHGNRVGTIDFYPDMTPYLGILCHLDVVPAGDGWKNPPFTLCMSNGKLFGRGTTDDKGPAVCVLYAMKAIKECGIALSKNVRFIVGTDEECGSSDLEWYKKDNKLPPYVFTPDASYPVINIEKGMIRGTLTGECSVGGGKTVISAKGGVVGNAVPASASARVRGFSADEIEAAVKKTPIPEMFSYETISGETTVTVTGKSAHASTPAGGINAVTALCTLLGSLETDDGTGKLFAALATLFPFGDTTGKALKIECSDEKSGALTEVLSVFEFSDNRVKAHFDMRLPTCTSYEKIRTKLTKAFDAKGFEISEFSGVAPHEVDGESEFVKTLLSVYESSTGSRGRCVSIGGGTYVHNIEGGVAFGAEFSGEDCRVHSANEFMPLERFKQNAKIFAEAIIKLCE